MPVVDLAGRARSPVLGLERSAPPRAAVLGLRTLNRQYLFRLTSLYAAKRREEQSAAKWRVYIPKGCKGNTNTVRTIGKLRAACRVMQSSEGAAVRRGRGRRPGVALRRSAVGVPWRTPDPLEHTSTG